MFFLYHALMIPHKLAFAFMLTYKKKQFLYCLIQILYNTNAVVSLILNDGSFGILAALLSCGAA